MSDFVLLNEGKLRHYAQRMGITDIDSKEEFIKYCYMEEDKAKLFLESSHLSQDEKLSIFYDEVLQQGNISLIIGRKGSGKSVCFSSIIDYLREFDSDRPIQMYKEFYVYNDVEIIYNVRELKQGSVLIIDELGVKFNSRESASEKNKLLSKLLVLCRHKNISVIATIQNTRMGDLNVFSLSDNMIFKELSPKQIETERENAVSEVDLHFINQLGKYDPSLTFFSNGEHIFLFNLPMPFNYNSKQYQNVDIKKDKEKIIKYIKGSLVEGCSEFEIYQDLALFGLNLDFIFNSKKKEFIQNWEMMI